MLETPQIHTLIQVPSVNLLFGKRGSGKSALCHYLLEKLSHKYKMPAGIVGFPLEKRYLIPQEYLIFNEFTFPDNCIIFIDEASFYLHARKGMQKSNVQMDVLISSARHRGWILIVATHHSMKLDINMIREADAIFYKEPSRMETEYGARQGFMEKLTRKVKKDFEALKELKVDRRNYVYLYTEDYEGLLYNSLPSYWSQELSCTTVRPL